MAWDRCKESHGSCLISIMLWNGVDTSRGDWPLSAFYPFLDLEFFFGTGSSIDYNPSN